MPISIESEINRASLLGQLLEHLVYNKSKEGKLAIDKNDDLLMGYWSMIFDYGKGVGCLLQNKFYSPAFALFRPIIEALVRACVVLVGTPDDVLRIRQDEFRVNYKKDGAWIDKALGTGTLLDDFLKGTKELLHSLTHSGTAQLEMRFDGNEVGAGVSDAQIIALLGAASNAAFLITILVAKHFDMRDVADAANKAFWDYGKESMAAASLPSSVLHPTI
jgi:hypothetical protein